MARKVGQIIRRGTRTWLVRVYSGRDPETKMRKYLNQTVHGGLRDAQTQLNKMLSERDRGRKLDSSKQTLNRFLDCWLELCAKPRLRAKSLKDYEGLLRRYVRPRLGQEALVSERLGPVQLATERLSGPVAGRFVFRYSVSNAGLSGVNSDYIGIDSVKFDVASVPESMTSLLAAAGVAVRARMWRRVR